jgi:hypothetical protein
MVARGSGGGGEERPDGEVRERTKVSVRSARAGA